MNLLVTYYLLSVAYCFAMSYRAYIMRGSNPIYMTPGLDSLVFLMMGPVLAPVDLFLTWVRIYKKAEEARRRNFLK